MKRLISLFCFALAACSSNSGGENFCESDQQCAAPGTRCNTGLKRCECFTDEACVDAEFCNRAGVCQLRPGCTVNLDCAAMDGTFCDRESGRCLPGPANEVNASCGLATHCPFNHVCADDTCVSGCNDDGDCQLGGICFNGNCTTTAGICSDDSFCGFRERCLQQQCREDRRGPYCRGCSDPSAANPLPCDDPRNFCLNNSDERGGFDRFCGVDCSLGQNCPNGYQCNFVVVLTRDACTGQAQCQCDPRRIRFATNTCEIPNACTSDSGCIVQQHPSCNPGGQGSAACLVATGTTSGSCTCDGNEDCSVGATCVAGRCCTGEIRTDRQCVGGEGDVEGFCTCSTDDDCPRDSCDLARGACAISGQPCTPGGGECGSIPCVNGGCQIGQNCAPLEGLSCSEVGG